MKTKMTLIAGLVIGLAASGTTLAASSQTPTPSTDVTAGLLAADLGRVQLDQLARKGADDRGPDDRGGRRHSEEQFEQLARRGADDRGPDDRGGRRGGRR
jgi:hypothetical protein